MNTIAKEIQVSGICLMDGKECQARIVPSSQKGIIFYPENTEIPVIANLENVISTQHCTVLGKVVKDKALQIRTVEHFMAACAFAGIDSLNIYLNSSELPILDGSGLGWVKAFQEAGIDKKVATNPIEIKEPIYFYSGNTSLVLLPADEFQISYSINFEHPELERKWYSWKFSNDHNEIIEARTFGYLKDLEKFQQAGFALGAKIDNIIGLTDSGYTIELRSKDEPIKHKILDLIGDLNLSGINVFSIKGHIMVKEAGHKTHVDFARIIQNTLERKL